jgi:hypothetical protein
MAEPIEGESMRIRDVMTAIAVALIAGGCSISASIGGSLESSAALISSPFKSSASSSGEQDDKKDEDDTQEQAYQRDVRDLTAAQLRRSDDLDTFRKELARVAKKHGISDWEAWRSTWVGIGEGIAATGVSSMQAQATIGRLAANHPDRLQALRQGYDRATVAAGSTTNG